MTSVRILLVDDHALFLRLAADFVNQHLGVTIVGTARMGEEALQQAQTTKPDVILLDLHIPDLTGLELIPLLRDMLPRVRIIVLSLLPEETYRPLSLAAGADAFVAKSKMSESLMPLIFQLTARARPSQSELVWPLG